MKNKATESLVAIINKNLEGNIIEVDYENDIIMIHKGKGLSICCEDEDDVYNSLQNILTGITLMII